MKYLPYLILLFSKTIYSQKTWHETSFESTEYGKKKDRNDGPFKDYDYVWAQPNGLYVVKKKVFVNDSIPTLNSFLVDSKGKILTKRVYTDMGDFSEGLAEITVGTKDFCRGCCYTGRYRYLSLLNRASGFINEKGEEVITPRYMHVQGGFKDGMCLVGNDELYFINTKGSPLFGKMFKYGNEFKNGIADVTLKSGEVNFINTLGELLIPDKFTYIEPYSEEFRGRIRAFQVNGDKIGFWTSENTPLVAPQFDEVNYKLLRNSIMVKKNNQVGFIDFYSAKEIIPLIYTDYRKDIQNNTILLAKDSVWYIARTSGKITRLAETGNIAGLGKGLYKFQYADKTWGITDSLGNTWQGQRYDSVADRHKKGFVQVFKGLKVGLVDEKRNELLAPEFDAIGLSVHGTIIAEKGVSRFIFDKKGKLLEERYKTDFLYKLLGASMVLAMGVIGFWIYKEGKSK